MANKCEPLLNVVKLNRLKLLISLNQKVCSRMFPCKLGTHGQTGLPADRRHLTYTVDYVKRGKPALSPIFGKLTARKADRNAGKERWKKRMPTL